MVVKKCGSWIERSEGFRSGGRGGGGGINGRNVSFFKKVSTQFTQVSSIIPPPPQPSMSALADQPDLPTSPYRTTAPRRVAQIHTATEKQEGAGMRVRRAIGTPHLRHLTPFLMLDHLDSAFGGPADAGAPDHPHRVCYTARQTPGGNLTTATLTRPRAKRQSRTFSPAYSATRTSRGTAANCARGICSS